MKMGNRQFLRMNPMLLGIMSLITIILSSVAVEVGSKVPSSGRTSLRMRVGTGDAIAGILATALLTIGDLKTNPYYFLPWLVLTLKGFISCEVPSLLGVGYKFIPVDGLPAAVFFFACAFLFVEELCVWSEVLNLFRWSWKIYMKRLTWEMQIKELAETKASMTQFMREIPNICRQDSISNICQ